MTVCREMAMWHAATRAMREERERRDGQDGLKIEVFGTSNFKSRPSRVSQASTIVAEALRSNTGCGLLCRRSPYQLESFFEHRRGFRRFEERPKDVVYEGGMGGKVGLKLLHGDRTLGSVIAHADRATL